MRTLNIAKIFGQEAGHLFEISCEMTLVGKAAVKSNFGQRHPGVFYQRNTITDFQLSHIFAQCAGKVFSEVF